MPDYQSMYTHLFNAVTDVLELLIENCPAAEKLRQAQIECEEMYMSTDP